MTNTTIFCTRVGHLNTLSKVLFLQMPKGRNCCCFKLNPGSPFVLGLIRKLFRPDGCWLNLYPASLDKKSRYFWAKKLILLLTRLSTSLKAVVQQLCASWLLWFLLTQSCQTKITVSRNPKHFRIHYLLLILHCRVWVQYIQISQLQFLKLFTLKSLYFSASGDIWK